MLKPFDPRESPASSFMAVTLPKSSGPETTALIAAKERLSQIEKHWSLGKVYGHQPGHFDRLMDDVLDVYQYLSRDFRAQIERRLRASPFHVRASQGMYAAQLEEELKGLVLSGFMSPTPSKKEPICDGHSRLWGCPEKRSAVRARVKAAELEGREPAELPIYGPLEAIDRALYWQGIVLDRYEKLKGRPAVKLYGSAREILSQSTRDVVRHASRMFVEANVSLIHGLGDHGAMGEGSRVWLQAMQELGKESEVIVGVVPLLFQRSARYVEKRTKGVTPGYVGPPQGIDTRTLLLSSLGVEVCQLFLKGGRGSQEELARNLLWRQMRASIHTPFSDLKEQPLAPLIVIDQIEEVNGEPTWYYHGTAWQEGLMRIGKAIDATDSQDVHFIRVGKELREDPPDVNIHYFNTAAEAAEQILKLCMGSIARARNPATSTQPPEKADLTQSKRGKR